MPRTSTLSDAAVELLRRHVEHGELPVDDSNRELHRELARAGLMVAVHTFTGGREQFYRFTREGWDFARSCASGDPHLRPTQSDRRPQAKTTPWTSTASRGEDRLSSGLASCENHWHGADVG